jgi:spermidine synthase
LSLAARCLSAAWLVGLAAAWAGMSWARLLEVALPTVRPAVAWALPCVLGGAFFGALLTGLASPRSLSAARRSLALAAGATLFLALPVAGASPDAWAGTITVLPAALAAACVSAGLAALAGVRRVPPTRALGAVLAAAAFGVAVGALSFVGMLTGDVAPTSAASIALLVAALLCLSPSPNAAGRAEPGEQDAAVARDAEPIPRVSLVSPFLAGFVLVLAAPALVTLMDQVHGAALTTRADLLFGLACGGVLAGMLPGVYARRAVGVRGYTMLGLGLALMLPHWLPGAVLDGFSGKQAALALGVPVGLFATGLVVLAARPGRMRGAARAGPLALAALGGVSGALWPVVWGGSDAGDALRGAALLCAVLSVPASLAARPPGSSFSAWARRWSASGLGVAAVYVFTLGTAAQPAWREAPDDRRLIRMVEDPRGVVAVVETADGGVRLGLDKRTLLSGTSGVLLERRMARLSAALAPTAEDALVLGLGDGQTAAELASLLPGTVRCVERVGGIVELAEAMPWASGPDATGPVLVHDEPLRELLSRRGTCELVVVIPEEPGRPGAGARMSREYYRVMREALAPEGVAVQWLPLHAMPWPAFASVAQAFLEAFPDTRLFVVSLLADVPVVALVGGLTDGLPGARAMDAVLTARPSSAGLGGSPDVYDLHLADGWTLLTRLRDAPASSVAHPWSEVLSMRRADDALALARINLRLLADIAVPLDTASMQVRPAEEQADRQLGLELVARSAAAVALLAARATGIELGGAAPGALSAGERAALEEAWHGLLLRAWSSAPGHLDAREALLERALALTREGRWELAATLLDHSIGVLADGTLQGLQCGVLLKLGQVDAAVAVGRDAVAKVPDDRTALLNCGSALLFAHRDTEALAMLVRARDAFRPNALPPLQIAALGLLEHDADSTALARALVERLPATEPWAEVLQRLLEAAEAGGD